MVRSREARNAPLRPRQSAARSLVAVLLSNIRRKLGFLKEDGDDFEDLVDVDNDDDEQEWVPFREVQYRWRRSEQGHMGYQLWMVKLIRGVDPTEATRPGLDLAEG